MSNASEFKKLEERYEKFNQLDEAADNENNRTANDTTQNPDAQGAQNLSTSGNDNEQQENLGGSTNLSLDQLKNGEAKAGDEE